MCTPMADAYWCMAKPIQNCKVKKIIIIIKLNEILKNKIKWYSNEKKSDVCNLLKQKSNEF